MTSRRRVRHRDEPRRTRLSHWRSDGGVKTRYRSEDEANRAAFAYRLEHGTDLAAYRCPICGGWHLGTQAEE
ncbi:MAG TPA: hypothetical protein VKU86_11955 [Acidimicrobiales bacterium]|nr:hypothetical protein [Acidimicrobiales bacterium]